MGIEGHPEITARHQKAFIGVGLFKSESKVINGCACIVAEQGLAPQLDGGRIAQGLREGCILFQRVQFLQSLGGSVGAMQLDECLVQTEFRIVRFMN